MSLVVLEGLLANEDEHSFLEHNRAFQHFAEVGVLRRIRIPTLPVPEAAYLGYQPGEVLLSQGPLIVSALGFDPPDRSVHFHLSLLSINDGVLSIPTDYPTSEELKALKLEADKFKTKLVTLLIGPGGEHGLVWEKLGEFVTHSAESVNGKNYLEVLPEGDGERDLRRLIDDSINELSNLEMNQRRQDSGKSLLNVFWPWGSGVRQRVPNLALRYGYPHEILSDSLRLQGLARLAGFRNKPAAELGNGIEFNFEAVSRSRPVLALTNVFAQLRRQSMLEEADWLAHEAGKRLVEPMLDYANEHNEHFSLIATNKDQALLVHFNGKARDNVYPFDERTLHEKKVLQVDIHEACRKQMTG